jgi:hypothetical protein
MSRGAAVAFEKWIQKKGGRMADKMSMDDLVFGKRVMENPAAGLDWALATLSASVEGKDAKAPAGPNHRANLRVALWCVEAPPGRELWDGRVWRALHSARMQALRIPGGVDWGMRLPTLWVAEEAFADAGYLVGMRAWVEAISRAHENGVPEASRSAFAKTASESEAARQWMAGKSPDALASLLEDSCETSHSGDPALTMVLAKALPPTQAWRVLSKACFPPSMAKALRGVDVQAAKALAQTTLSDPVLAHDLLHSVMFSNLSASVGSVHDPLEGLLAALADNPRPALAPSRQWLPRDSSASTPPKRPTKVLLSGVGALSVAAQLLCADRPGPGLAAARWAAKLGAAGRSPQAWRRDSVGFETKFNLFVDCARWDNQNAFRRCSVSVDHVRQIPLTLRDYPTQKALAELGWGWPSKGDAKKVVARLQSALSGVPKSAVATPLWRGEGGIDSAGAGAMAFWEECELRRIQAKALRKSDSEQELPAPSSRPLRI